VCVGPRVRPPCRPRPQASPVPAFLPTNIRGEEERKPSPPYARKVPSVKGVFRFLHRGLRNQKPWSGGLKRRTRKDAVRALGGKSDRPRPGAKDAARRPGRRARRTKIEQATGRTQRKNGPRRGKAERWRRALLADFRKRSVAGISALRVTSPGA
jgi:hypothetical protein